jgi:hypothetical protein
MARRVDFALEQCPAKLSGNDADPPEICQPTVGAAPILRTSRQATSRNSQSQLSTKNHATAPVPRLGARPKVWLVGTGSCRPRDNDQVRRPHASCARVRTQESLAAAGGRRTGRRGRTRGRHSKPASQPESQGSTLGPTDTLLSAARSYRSASQSDERGASLNRRGGG